VDVRRTLIVSICLLIFAGPLKAADRPVLVCYGDSITAGYGLQTGQSFPDALQRDLDSRGYHYKVNNQGTSGATTKDAVADLRSILLLHPEVVIVEFGGNDGLRGLPPDQTRRNLDQVLTTLENAHIKILLAGITLPAQLRPATTSSNSSRSSATSQAKHHTSLRAHDLQRPGPRPRHHPARRHPSHRQRLRDHRANAAACALAAAA
jgi:lysophospholipase L1-like esterase